MDTLFSLIWYCHSVSSLYPQPSAGTQIKKKETRIEQRNTDRSFHGSIFFDIIELMILGFWLWIYWDLRVLGHSLSWWYQCCYITLHIDISPPCLPRMIPHPNLPQGKGQVTLQLIFSPHLASPVGEGQIPLAAWQLSDYHLQLSDYQSFINSNSNCPSPSGEVRWGLKFIGWIDWLKSLTKQSNLFLPLGKVRMGLRLGWVIIRGRLGGGWWQYSK